MSEASSTVSSCHGARQTISKSTKTSAAFDSLGVREETRVVAGQILAASPRQCTCSQGPEHPAVPSREEHHRTGTTSYSPDLAPCDFFLFPKLKGMIKGTRFEGVEAIKRAVTTQLRGTQKNPSSSA